MLFLEGVRTENYRILRSLKNRFGTTDVVGLFQMKEDGLKGPLTKFFDEADLQAIVAAADLHVGDAIFFGAGEKKLVLDYMGRFRIFLAEQMNIIPKDVFEFVNPITNDVYHGISISYLVGAEAEAHIADSTTDTAWMFHGWR